MQSSLMFSVFALLFHCTFDNMRGRALPIGRVLRPDLNRRLQRGVRSDDRTPDLCSLVVGAVADFVSRTVLHRAWCRPEVFSPLASRFQEKKHRDMLETQSWCRLVGRGSRVPASRRDVGSRQTGAMSQSRLSFSALSEISFESPAAQAGVGPLSLACLAHGRML